GHVGHAAFRVAGERRCLQQEISDVEQIGVRLPSTGELELDRRLRETEQLQVEKTSAGVEGVAIRSGGADGQLGGALTRRMDVAQVDELGKRLGQLLQVQVGADAELV